MPLRRVGLPAGGAALGVGDEQVAVLGAPFAVDLDLRELDRLIADAERAEQPADQRRLLEQALSLVRGRPLTDIGLPWAGEAARRLTSSIATLLERTGRARLADGEPRLAIDAAEQGLAVDG